MTAQPPDDFSNGFEALQLEVQRIFAEVLDVESVSPNDDFFELGGHSLMVILLAERLSEMMGVRVSIREVFDAPTAAAVAALVQSRRLS